MAFSKTTIFTFFIVVSTFRASMGAVYTVGDEKGWRKAGDSFYNDWASGKNFQVGDVLVFQYDPNEHNVFQVTSQDFDSCTTTAALNAFSSGNDNIDIAETGTYYYICGVPNHCAAGMKLQIAVGGGESTATPGSPNPRGPGTPSPLGSRNPGQLPAGGENPVPFPHFETSASSTLSSKGLIVSMLGLLGIVALEHILGFAF